MTWRFRDLRFEIRTFVNERSGFVYGLYSDLTSDQPDSMGKSRTVWAEQS